MSLLRTEYRFIPDVPDLSPIERAELTALLLRTHEQFGLEERLSVEDSAMALEGNPKDYDESIAESVRQDPDFISIRDFFGSFLLRTEASTYCAESIALYGETALDNLLPRTLIPMIRRRLDDVEGQLNRWHQDNVSDPPRPDYMRCIDTFFGLKPISYVRKLAEYVDRKRNQIHRERVKFVDYILGRYERLAFIVHTTAVPAAPDPASAGTPQSGLQLQLR